VVNETLRDAFSPAEKTARHPAAFLRGSDVNLTYMDPVSALSVRVSDTDFPVNPSPGCNLIPFSLGPSYICNQKHDTTFFKIKNRSYHRDKKSTKARKLKSTFHAC
jgi:hypothetical protein